MDGDLALKYLDATPKCPRTETITKPHGRGMGGKASIEEVCGAVLTWVHTRLCWDCPKHGPIDEARPSAVLKGNQREGYSTK